MPLHQPPSQAQLSGGLTHAAGHALQPLPRLLQHGQTGLPLALGLPQYILQFTMQVVKSQGLR